MPKKPTSAFGNLVFSKDGRVRRNVFRLSTDKAMQEQEAVQRFVVSFNNIDAVRRITNVVQLPERDHDFSAQVAAAPIQIELTELVERSFVFPMTVEELKTRKGPIVIAGSGTSLRRLDEERRDQALTDLIARKVGKSYSSTSETPTWLVVFSTSQYATEYVSAGQLMVSEALRRARAYLSAQARTPFQQVWFTDLQSQPIQVWPRQ
jgi:hypothetical protein